MVHLAEHRGTATAEPRHDMQMPQRLVARKLLGEEPVREPRQRLIADALPGLHAEMIGQPERGAVNPSRAAQSAWRRADDLAKAGHEVQARAEAS